MSKTKSSYEIRKHEVWFVYGIVIVVWLLLAYIIYLTSIGPTEVAKLGQFGDSFGVVNCLFSALAFASIWLSLKYQKKDFELQVEELRRGIDVQEDSADSQEINALINIRTALLNKSLQEMGHAKSSLDLPDLSDVQRQTFTNLINSTIDSSAEHQKALNGLESLLLAKRKLKRERKELA